MSEPIPLPKGIAGIKETPKLQESLTNLMLHDGYLMRTPAHTIIGSTIDNSRPRGSVKWYADERPYFVAGDKFYRIEQNLDRTEIGFGLFDNGEDVVFSNGQVNLVGIEKNGRGFYWDGATLKEISSPNFRPSVSVDFIDGRHVFIPADGSPAFFSGIDSPNDINALSFFDAEELPDKNRFVININNELVIGGGEAFQTFRTTADINAPFVPRGGSRVDVGYVGGGRRYLGTFAFIGRRRDENFAIFVMGSGDANKISNSAIDEMLNSNYTEDQLKNVNVFTYNWRGADVIGWNLPDRTICYYDGNWFYMDSAGDDIISPWAGRDVVFAYDSYFVFVAENDFSFFGRLTFEAKDISESLVERTEFKIETYIRGPKNSNFSLKSLELDCLLGNPTYGNTIPMTIGLRLSRETAPVGGYLYRDLSPPKANNRRRIRWAGGLGRFPSYVGITLRSSNAFPAHDLSFTLEALRGEFT